ncbi:MAG: hypothetical protein HYT16_00095 [DPANN group archaeon]|nr:hypothetical protein [DPANN group archaeon]
MFSSTIEIKGEKEVLDTYFSALEPEQAFETERANYRLKKAKGKLVIDISANDATAFRAVSSSISGLLAIVDRTINIASKVPSSKASVAPKRRPILRSVDRTMKIASSKTL